MTLRAFVVNVNGASRSVTCEPTTPLLYPLRNDWRLVGAKFGCGLGECGACMVLFNGAPEASCQLTVETAAGGEVTSIEGLSDDRYAGALRRTLTEEQAAQCGYCISGIVVSAVALLRHAGGVLRREPIERALEPHLCRCGVHNRVVRAVARASEMLDG